MKAAITTDHPVSLIQSLPICAGLAVKAGLDEMEALKAITLYPAQICRVGHRLGSLEVGKDGDVAIFNCLPTRVEAKAMCTIIEGKIAYADESFPLPEGEKKL